MNQQIQIQKSLANRDKYYHSFVVLRNITNLLRFRYLSFSNRDKDIIKEKDGDKYKITHLNRYNRAHHHIEFFKTYDRFDFKNIKFLRLYLCLITLKTTFPVLPRSGPERTKMKKFVQKNLGKYVDGFDLAWDFDIPKDIDKCSVCGGKEGKDYTKCKADIYSLRDEVLEFNKFFNKYNVSVSNTFSGQRGFHVRIPNEYLHPILQKNYKRIININKKIALFHNNLHIDTFGNDIMKLLKLPYSVDGNAPNFNVVLPLDYNQLSNFNINNMKMDYVIKNIRLVDKFNNPRGLIFNNFNNMIKQHENVLGMFSDIENW